jgi:hypothetical protein
MGGELTQVDGSFNGDVQMWPNPVADGRVNLALNGLVDNDQKIQLDLYDMYGRKVLARDYGNSGKQLQHGVGTAKRSDQRCVLGAHHGERRYHDPAVERGALMRDHLLKAFFGRP